MPIVPAESRGKGYYVYWHTSHTTPEAGQRFFEDFDGALKHVAELRGQDKRCVFTIVYGTLLVESKE